jgi:5-methyltetrahydrofolate--homocysteine methyltransferase
VNDLLGQIARAVVDQMPKRTAELAARALKTGIAPRQILLDGLAAGMRRVGELFATKEYFVPDVLLAARALESGFAVIRPQLEAGALPNPGRIAIGVVQGDIHDIGKNIVKVLLQAEGYELVDLGRDVSTDRFVQAVEEHAPDILGLSSLMSTTMPTMEDVIKALDRSGLRSRVKVLVGGAPLTPEFACNIGADAYAPDAPAAIAIVRTLLARGCNPSRPDSPSCPPEN